MRAAQKLKIAMFTDVFFDVAGGITTSILNTKTELEKLGHEVYVFAPGRADSTLPGKRRAGRNVYKVPTHRYLSPGGAPLAKRPEVILRWLEENHPELADFDLIHAHYEASCSLSGALYARRHGLPLVQTMHGREDVAIATNVPHPLKFLTAAALCFLHGRYLPHTAKVRKNQSVLAPTRARALMWTLMAGQANAADVVISPSRHFADKLQACGVTRPLVKVSNGLADAELAQMPATVHKWQHGPLKLVWSSRVSREKRILPLLESLVLLNAQGLTDWELTVFGAGNDLQRAWRFVAANGLSKQVRFHGQVAGGRVRRELPRSHFSVLVSYGFDTQGLTLLEAAAGGLPVFFCDPDLREVVPPAGALFASGPAPEQMAAALGQIFRHPERIAKMSQAMLEFRPRVSAGAQVRELLKAYRQARKIAKGSQRQLKKVEK